MNAIKSGIVVLIFLVMLGFGAAVQGAPMHEAELIAPLEKMHHHAAGIVECANGDLLVSWYRGKGERDSDDVKVIGSRRRKGATTWETPFVMADVPGFPDCNTCMMIDTQDRLWLFWPVIIANTWESCITNYRTSTNYTADGPPKWDWQGTILLKPDNLKEKMDAAYEQRLKEIGSIDPDRKARLDRMIERSGEKLYQRLGWQPRCKPTVLPTGRILFPLYTDTFSACIMAISDDKGETWYASDPIIGFGNIQASVLRRNDGTLVAYMRNNAQPKRIRVSESKDDGLTWGPVTSSELLNPGAGVDGVRLDNGHWVMVYNDLERGRFQLAVSISDDEGKTWKWTRHLEKEEKGSYHYPVVIQGRDGTIHAVYSYSNQGEGMKHAAFSEDWVKEGSVSK